MVEEVREDLLEVFALLHLARNEVHPFLRTHHIPDAVARQDYELVRLLYHELADLGIARHLLRCPRYVKAASPQERRKHLAWHAGAQD